LQQVPVELASRIKLSLGRAKSRVKTSTRPDAPEMTVPPDWSFFLGFFLVGRQACRASALLL
jgi:hypothetical protein